MKQSIGLVILQILSIVLGFVSVFFVAGSLPPNVYAVMGVYHVITALITVFSNTGLDVVAQRNVLHWSNQGNEKKVKEIVTQALFMRVVFATAVMLIAFVYAFYISKHKFGGAHLLLFILMCVSGVVSAFSDSIGLILKAFNHYFLSALSVSIIGVFGKIIALALFLKYGFIPYVAFTMLLPAIVSLPLILLVRKHISIRHAFDVKNIIKNLKHSMPFALSSYFRYLFKFADQFLVSIFMSPEILASFDVVKKIQNIVATFIANMFDPSMQKLVQFKGQIDVFKQRLGKILKMQKVLLILGLLLWPAMFYVLPHLLSGLNLSKYPHVNISILLVLLAEIIALATKVRYGFIALFYKPRINLFMSVLHGVIHLVCFVLVALFTTKYLFFYLVLTNLLINITVNIIYVKQKHGCEAKI